MKRAFILMPMLLPRNCSTSWSNCSNVFATTTAPRSSAGTAASAVRTSPARHPSRCSTTCRSEHPSPNPKINGPGSPGRSCWLSRCASPSRSASPGDAIRLITHFKSQNCVTGPQWNNVRDNSGRRARRCRSAVVCWDRSCCTLLGKACFGNQASHHMRERKHGRFASHGDTDPVRQAVLISDATHQTLLGQSAA